MVNTLRIAGIGSILFLGACLGEATAPESTVWKAQLLPTTAESTTTADVAAIARPQTIEVGITVYQPPADTTLSWNLSTGTCEDVGSVLGTQEGYPDLSTGTGGEVSTQTSVLGTLRESSSYVGVLYDRGGVLIACGSMEIDPDPLD